MESLFFYYDTLSPTFIEFLIFLFLASQMVYLLFFTNHNYLGAPFLGTSANYFLVIFLCSLLINFLFFADPLYASFSNHINVNSQTLLVRDSMVFTSLIVIVFSMSYLRLKKICQYEFSLLFLFSVAGLAFTTLSADFLTIFMTLELQGLAFYLLATFYWGSEFNAEAGLKYFVLSSFTSALLLFGFSLIYILSGATSFEAAQLIAQQQSNSGIVLLGLAFSLSALLFKVGAAPFHVWLCDVYEGSLTPITFFFVTVPKIVIFNVLLTLFLSVFFFENFY
jgi:NADH:ubiquinone oxidoreductase subunit 2 (subunit N)